MQFGADFELPNLSSQADMNQLPQHAIVQELRDALYSATQAIKSLKEDNKWLKEKIVLLKDDQRQEVSQLREELQKKDELQERVTKKLRDRTKAHVEILNLLTQKEEELKSTCDALKARFKDQMAQKKKIWNRKLQKVKKKKGSRHKKPFEKVQKSRPKESQTAEDTERIISENNQPQVRQLRWQ